MKTNNYARGQLSGLKNAADIIAQEYDRASCGSAKASLLFAAAEIKKAIDATRVIIAKDED